MTSTSVTRSPLDPGLAEVHNSLSADSQISTPEQIEARRKDLAFRLEDVIRGKEDTAPGFLHVHPGGFVGGNRFIGVGGILSWVEVFGAVIVSAEYRLAPEHPQPAQLEDSYAALLWFTSHAEELSVDLNHIFVIGASAGGNLAAGVTLLARDRAGPKIRGQLLAYPVLEENYSVSSFEQYGNMAPWTAANSYDAFEYALGKHREHANGYTLPLRMKDLTGLPPTFIDVGEADVVRDEDVKYASELWKAGVSTELHVWPGAWHGFDVYMPAAPISQKAVKIRGEWVRRLLKGQ
ncbi:hypothetical protein N7468_000413 [Penicillium chermesinum]|uniref:Alpha/beta hydrolase fold-3 domain-containing protein n=1 Tax=Penicillium chermesinum TaxID=63820 RepID=A0A9W9TYE0_9EURO|nr:uncharacterized protein N7468_000413 [Penicillium chermesinum]KAJ5248962.1 hypothetical protein N7468_000413 [Penicillium chermesinum]